MTEQLVLGTENWRSASVLQRVIENVRVRDEPVFRHQELAAKLQKPGLSFQEMMACADEIADCRLHGRNPFAKKPQQVLDSLTLQTVRRNRRGHPYVQNQLRVGPNSVRCQIFRRDGTIEDLGVTVNLLTNIGRDWWQQIDGFIPVQNNPATSVGATSLTGTGTTWTASNLATPQLGIAGLRVVAPVTGITTAPVYGNVVSNSTSVLTIDKWWNAADGTGTTPANTNNFILMPGGASALRFLALSTDSGGALATHTTLTSEVTTGNCGRVLALYTHTLGQSTTTLSNTFTANATVTGIHKIGLFTCLTSAGADPMIYETTLNVDATLASGDTLAVTWTGTYSG